MKVLLFLSVSFTHTQSHTHTHTHPFCSPVANDGQLKAHSWGANQICRPVIGLQWVGRVEGGLLSPPPISLSLPLLFVLLSAGE